MTAPAKHEESPVERWGWYSIGVNLVVVAIHAAVAVFSGSLAVTAELLHNLTDTLTAVALLVGLKLAMRKSRSFPYGLYKLENLIAAGMAFAIFFTAYEIGHEALLGQERSVSVSLWMLIGVLLSTAIPLVFSHFEMRIGTEYNSPALVADAREFRVHFLTTGLVLVSLLTRRVELPIDRIAALLILVAIVRTGWGLLSDAMRVLLDASLDAETLQKIRRIIEADPALSELKWLTGRNAGRFRFVEAGVGLRVKDLSRAEAVIQRIESQVRRKVPHVERVLIHAEPAAATHLRFAMPLADSDGTISAHFGSAPYFAIATLLLQNKKIEDQEVVVNPFRAEERKKGLQVANWLIAHGVDVVLSAENLEGKGPWFALGDGGVEIAQVQAATVDEAIRGYTAQMQIPPRHDGQSEEEKQLAAAGDGDDQTRV